jgi:hypothetical protein
METIWKKGVVTLAKAFYYDVAQTISVFQDYIDNPSQFGSVKDLCTNWRRWVSMAGQQHGTDSFVDLAKRIKAFPATECACERLFCQLRNLVGDFRHQISDSMNVDLLVVKTRIIWPKAHRSKCALRLSGKWNHTAGQTKQPPDTATPGKVLSFQSPPVIPKRELSKHVS